MTSRVRLPSWSFSFQSQFCCFRSPFNSSLLIRMQYYTTNTIYTPLRPGFFRPIAPSVPNQGHCSRSPLPLQSYPGLPTLWQTAHSLFLDCFLAGLDGPACMLLDITNCAGADTGVRSVNVEGHDVEAPAPALMNVICRGGGREEDGAVTTAGASGAATCRFFVAMTADFLAAFRACTTGEYDSSSTTLV